MLLALALALSAVVWGFTEYTRLVRGQIRVERAWSGVENLCQRRSDLVANLIDRAERRGSVRGNDLRRLSESNAAVREIVLSPQILEVPGRFLEFQRRQNDLTRTVAEVLPRLEADPRLASDRAFPDLAAQLRDLEAGLAEECAGFREEVGRYDSVLDGFPASFLAPRLGFGPGPECGGMIAPSTVPPSPES
jgi:hypothetical protein